MQTLSKHRVLIVDDEQIWQTLLAELVDQAQFQYDVCETAEKAENLLNQNLYSLALIDLCLNGNDIAMEDKNFWVKLNNLFPYLPIIAVSGQALSIEKTWDLTTYGFKVVISKSHISAPGEFRDLIQTHMLSLQTKVNENYEQVSNTYSQHEPEIAKEELESMLNSGKAKLVINELLQLCKNDSDLLHQVIFESNKWYKAEKDANVYDLETLKVRKEIITDNLQQIIDKLFV